MRHILQSFRALGTTLRNLHRPVVTVQYPQVLRQRTERFRASFALLHDENGEESCIACGLCELICPSRIIVVQPGEKRASPFTQKKRGYLEDFRLDSNACIYCELCVQVCPVDAIVMVSTPEIPAYAREDLLLTMAKLYANEHLKPASWANGTRLCAMQDPSRGLASVDTEVA
jgi:NADH-quinone oxidoreductase subunit I